MLSAFQQKQFKEETILRKISFDVSRQSHSKELKLSLLHSFLPKTAIHGVELLYALRVINKLTDHVLYWYTVNVFLIHDKFHATHRQLLQYT